MFAWLAAVLSAGYMLPWAIGATRNRTNCAATALVNFFLGWTLIGWVIALVMACGSEPAQPVVVQTIASTAVRSACPTGSHASALRTVPWHRSASGAELRAYPGVSAIPSPAASRPTAEVTMPLPPYGTAADADASRHHPRRDDLR